MPFDLSAVVPLSRSQLPHKAAYCTLRISVMVGEAAPAFAGLQVFGRRELISRLSRTASATATVSLKLASPKPNRCSLHTAPSRGGAAVHHRESCRFGISGPAVHFWAWGFGFEAQSKVLFFGLGFCLFLVWGFLAPGCQALGEGMFMSSGLEKPKSMQTLH